MLRDTEAAFQAHDAGACHFSNLVCRAVGHGSLVGRAVGRTLNDLSWFSTALSDLAFEAGEPDRDDLRRGTVSPSPAAAAVETEAAKLDYPRRLQPMTPSARAAVSAYIDERAALIEAFERAATKSWLRRAYRPAAHLGRQRRLIERVRAFLVA